MNYSSLRNIFCFVILSLLLWACASTGRPSGGPKDIKPPSLVVEESPPNFSTNYSPDKIELVFDEWIELKNQAKEILISPPFFKQPKITQRGKKVIIEFPEEEPLRKDATYTLNFGEAIVDFTEANPAKGFKFLFATGDKLDSLKFEGSIVDAYGGEPVKDVLIMLYDMLGDSVVVTEKPFYYARADEDGRFNFEYLKNDTFKLIVIEDINLNYLLDDEVERLAFIDSTFMLNDSSKFKPELRLFTPEQSTRIINSNSKTPGLITTVFNKKADLVDHTFLYPESFNPFVETVGDTMKFWFDTNIDSAGIVYGLDTLDFILKPFDTIFYNRKINIENSNLIKSRLAPFDSLMLSFSAPVASIDTSFITLSDKPKVVRVDSQRAKIDTLLNRASIDSLNVDKVLSDTISLDSLITKKDELVDSNMIDSLGIEDSLSLKPLDTISYYLFDYTSEGKKLIVQNDWKQSHDYQLIILPGGVTDIYGRTNDTILFDFKTNSIEDYGNINLTVSGMDSLEQYIVILRDGENQVKETIISDLKTKQILFERLPVSVYNVHLIKDENRDGKWTTGDYWKGRQPELLKKFELEQLRENWDLEANISWDGTMINALGVDSTSVQLDSLGQLMKSDIKDKSKKKDQSGSNDEPNNRRGIRGRKG